MPNGDMLTANYQFQLHSTLYGTGNNGVSIDIKNPIEGLGVPDAKTQDVVYNSQDGSYANPDHLAVRQINIATILRGVETTVMTNLKALLTVWVPQPTDIDLAFQLPGWNKFYVMGRPRGAKVDLALERRGAVRVLLRFDCPNPTITYL